MNESSQHAVDSKHPEPQSLDAFCERVCEIVRKVIQEEISKLKAVEQPDPTKTGIQLSPDQQQVAAQAKAAIQESALNRQGLIGVERLAEMLDISKSSIWKLIAEKAMPEPIHIGRVVRWRELEILAWLEEGCPVGERWALVRKRAVREYEVARRTK